MDAFSAPASSLRGLQDSSDTDSKGRRDQDSRQPRGPSLVVDDLALCLRLSFDPACLLDEDGSVRQSNRAMESVLGRKAGDLADVSLAELLDAPSRPRLRRAHELAPGESAGFEAVFEVKGEAGEEAGRLLPCRVHIGRASCGDPRLLLIARPLDPAHDKDALERMALHDPLTGLPNRALLLDRIEHAAAHAKRWKSVLALFFIDLDGFKPVNDVHGHECGDHVLVVTAERIKASIRASDSAARLGGDEFVAVLGELHQEVHAGLAAGKIVREIAKPIAWGGGFVSVNASLGISLFPADGEDPEDLLKKADQAMYRAKRSGKNGYAFYDESRFF